MQKQTYQKVQVPNIEIPTYSPKQPRYSTSIVGTTNMKADFVKCILTIVLRDLAHTPPFPTS